ncbi:unnamed protein product [Diplocarpon coronariae]
MPPKFTARGQSQRGESRREDRGERNPRGWRRGAVDWRGGGGNHAEGEDRVHRGGGGTRSSRGRAQDVTDGGRVERKLGDCGERPERVEDTPEQRQSRNQYNGWRRLIKDQPESNDTRTMGRIWTGALQILNDDNREFRCYWMPENPAELPGPALYIICNITSTNSLMGMRTHLGGSERFVDLAEPFLSVITHQALLDCLAVDTVVGEIYMFVGGTHGSRALPFFQEFCKNLLDNHFGKGSEVTTRLENMMIAISRALHKILRRQNKAKFSDDLLALVESMMELMATVDIDAQSVTFKCLSAKVEELREMVALARGFLYVKPRSCDVTTGVLTSTYPRTVELSHGRHDNDMLDISQIKIIPPEAEIRGKRAEFLPSTNPDMSHFLDPALRHIDTHFRMLRHHIFGELKEALGGLILAVEQDISLIETPKLNVGNIRAYAYPEAEFTGLTVDARRELEVELSFPQPPLVRLSCKKSLGVLVELPGMTLGTFKSILESLQSMYPICHFPFRQWIVPDRTQLNNSLPIDIPPPAYARTAGFTFPLNSILKEGNGDLCIDPVEPADGDLVGGVESQTTLDRSQCEALVAALSHEFVQIQGSRLQDTRKDFDRPEAGFQTIQQLLTTAAGNVSHLQSPDRARLAKFWVSEFQKNPSDDLNEAVKKRETLRQGLKGIYEEIYRELLATADVIGILICEEAGETMEPHFLTALLPTVEHVISIGDHQQLRPQINNFTFHVSQLNVQPRMRPQISNLIRATIYSFLVDHEDTRKLPDVVEMAHALLRHIIRQGAYSSQDIAVLSPYTGQLQKLRAKFRSEFEIVLSDRDQEALARDGFADKPVPPESQSSK